LDKKVNADTPIPPNVVTSNSPIEEHIEFIVVILITIES